MRIRSNLVVYGVSVVVAFGSFVFGYSLVCISMMADSIKESLHIEGSAFDYQLSLITTLLPLGALVGSFCMRPLCEKLGEHKAMFYLDILGATSIALQAFQIDYWNVYLGRLFLGFYVGIASGIVPSYLISLSPPEISGIVGSFNQLLITIGIAAAYALGLTQMTWLQYMVVPGFFCVARAIILLFFPFDTLERHYRKGENEALQRYVDQFYSEGSVENLVAIRNLSAVSVAPNQKESNCISSVKQIPKSVLKLALVLALANQLSGINAILFYARQVFEHITNHNALLSKQYTLYLGLLQVLITFGSGFLINRFGRRTLMLFGETMVVSSLLIGFMADVSGMQNILVAVVFAHIIGFSLSLGPVSMLYVAEMMEDMSVVIGVVWGLTLGVSMASEVMIKELGIGKVFLFYGLVSSWCLWYLWRWMAESKGLSRAQLVGRLESKPAAIAVEEERVRLHEENGTTAEI